MARATGLDQGYISSIERGKKVNIDKATIKKIGRVFGKDFNEEVMYICMRPTKNAGKSMIASTEGPSLIVDKEHTMSVRGHNFAFKCTISTTDFKVILKSEVLGDEKVIYQGKIAKDVLFLEALKAVAKLVDKGI